MDPSPSLVSSPSAPEGFVYAGPASEFISSTAATSTIVSTEDNTDCLEVTSVAAGADCQHKGTKDGEEYLIKVVEIPQPAGCYPPQKRVAISHFHEKWYGFINICPHQGSALSRGSMMDIEDMGIVWGAGVTCSLHNWTFDAQSGQSDSTRFVIDTYDVKEIDGHVFVSQTPRNNHVAGPRRDFGGREMN
ncbi:hypothetical protein EDD11_008987 [Mortierella claussenii]|nr:hypothetical protein EDD11_008987 [Mortierella claussenii]